MKKLDYYLALPYTIELQYSATEWFARVRELRGCTSAGNTAVEAVKMIQEAMTLWLTTAIEENIPIPVPFLLHDHLICDECGSNLDVALLCPKCNVV